MAEGKRTRSAAHAVTQGDIAEDMRNDDGLRGAVGISVLDRDCYVRGRLPWSAADEFRRWRDSDDAYLYTYEQERVGARSREDVRGAFRILCAENEFNPIADMLKGLPKWDHEPRARFMLWALFGATDGEYTRAVSELWMRGAVRRAFEPGCKFDYTLVLKGAQGIKKSLTGRRLAMREEFFFETVTAITNPKITAEQVGGKWIVEIGELSGMRGRDLEAVKAALTAQKTTVRKAYDRYVSDVPRSCVFLATTNERTFLTDHTGNRRFLPVACGESDERKGWDVAGSGELEAFIEQAWAEIVYRYQSAKIRAADEDEFLRLFPLMLDDEGERLAEAVREESFVEDTRVGAIGEWLEEQLALGVTRVSTRMVAEGALHVEGEGLERNNKLTNEIGNILNESFPEWRFVGKRRIKGSSPVRSWDYVGGAGR